MATILDLFTPGSNAGTDNVNPTYYAALINATDIESGKEYEIAVAGTTNFTLIGAADSNVGTVFTANSTTPTGTGTVYKTDTGMYGRFKNVKEGNVITYGKGSYTGSNPNVFMQNVAKYTRYYGDSISNEARQASVYDFANLPLFNFTKTSYNMGVDDITATTNSSSEPIVQFTTDSAQAHVVDGDQVDFSASDGLIDHTRTYYVDSIDSSTFQLYTDSGRTIPYAGAANTLDHTDNVRFIGNQMFFKQNTNPLSADNTARQMKFFNADSPNYAPAQPSIFDLSVAHQGTLNTKTNLLYLSANETQTTNNTSVTLNKRSVYTNSGRTTAATMTEEYSSLITRSYSAGSGGATEGSFANEWHLSDSNPHSLTYTGNVTNKSSIRTELKRQMDTFGIVFVRIHVSSNSSAWSNSPTVNGGIGISGAVGSLIFGYYDDSAQILYTGGRLGTTPAGMTDGPNHQTDVNDRYHVSGRIAASQTVGITVSIIDCAELPSSGTTGTLAMTTTSASVDVTGSSINFGKRFDGNVTVNKHFISGGTMIHHGNQKYQYQDASNATANGAVFTGKYYKSNTAGDTMTSAETPDGSILTINSSGYLTGVSFSGVAYTNNNGGIWDDADEIHINIGAQPDVFVARTLTTAELEDVFDTQDYWASGAYNQNKEWPRNVTPTSAKIIQNHPSTTNISQNGTKFVRSAGFTKWQLELTYPPMTAEDFSEFQAVANAVQGQNIPFIFINRNQHNNPIIFDMGYTNTNNVTTLKQVIKPSVGDSLHTVGGFYSDQTKAFNKGEVVIFKNSNNASYHVIVAEVDANIYGEAKVRLAYPTNSVDSSGIDMFKNPFNILCTLAEDSFEYQISTEGYYYLTCKLDFDENK